MNSVEMTELTRAMREIVWHFGPKGLDGTCCANLSMPEFQALDKVAETPDCPVQDIGLQLGFTKSGATRVVNRLEKKGYVQKIKSNQDGRICCVVITETGEHVLRSADAGYFNKLERLFSMMPKNAIQQMKHMLVTLSRTLKRE
ncbi:MAG: MarR family transcriptional regulator [Desulfatirhabdiaceae bacterium]